MANPHNCSRKRVRGLLLSSHARSFPGSSAVRPFIIAAVIVLMSATSSNVEAISGAGTLELQLPGVDGWQITAIRMVSVICSATKSNNGTDQHVIADKGGYEGYQGGVIWSLSVDHRLNRLKAGVDETEAKLLLNSRFLAIGKAVRLTSTYTRFEFRPTAMDSSINDLETPGSLEIKAEGIDPIALESLSPIISALKKCHQDSSEPDFWKNAKKSECR